MTVMQRFRRGAFSLVELVVVIGLIGLMVGLLLPAVQKAREASYRAGCINNLRQVGLATHLYHDSQGTLPAAYCNVDVGLGTVLPWTVLILPYIEQEALWKQTLDAYRVDFHGYHNPPHIGLATVLGIYVCPSDGRLQSPITDDQGYTAAYYSYQGVAGDIRSDGALREQKGVRLSEITDGTSQTLLVGERPAAGRSLAGSWYTIDAGADPAWPTDDYSGGRLSYMCVYSSQNFGNCQGPFKFGPGQLQNPCDFNHFWSPHPGGANFLFADGSVHFISYSAASIMPALASRAGGEVVDLP